MSRVADLEIEKLDAFQDSIVFTATALERIASLDAENAEIARGEDREHRTYDAQDAREEAVEALMTRTGRIPPRRGQRRPILGGALHVVHAKDSTVIMLPEED